MTPLGRRFISVLYRTCCSFLQGASADMGNRVCCFPRLRVGKKKKRRGSEKEKNKKVKTGVASEKTALIAPRSENFGEVAGAQHLKPPEEVLSESGACDREITTLPPDDVEREVNQSQGSRETEELQLKGKSLEDFKLLRVLGRGTFGKVFLAELKDTEEVYALKFIKKETIRSNDEMKYITRERDILTLASKHPYLTQLYCCFQTNHYLCFAMEYMKGELHDLIKMFRGLDENFSRFCAAEIACALMFLHRNGIIHRDLKPSNILLDADGHFRLADFGSCKDGILDGMTTTTICGTPKYMAPEMIQRMEYGASVDWWALGVIMYEMMTGDSPFCVDSHEDLLKSILHDKICYPRRLSRKAVRVLKAFLHRNPNSRLGCVVSKGKEEAIKVHPFFKTIDWVLLEQKKIISPFAPQITTNGNVNNDITSRVPMLTLMNNTISQSSQELFKDFSIINSEYLADPLIQGNINVLSQ